MVQDFKLVAFSYQISGARPFLTAISIVKRGNRLVGESLFPIGSWRGDPAWQLEELLWECLQDRWCFPKCAGW